MDLLKQDDSGVLENSIQATIEADTLDPPKLHSKSENQDHKCKSSNIYGNVICVSDIDAVVGDGRSQTLILEHRSLYVGTHFNQLARIL